MPILLVILAQAGQQTDLLQTVVGYGVAAPLVAFLVWYINQQNREREALTTRLEQQQKELSTKIEQQQKEYEKKLEDVHIRERDLSERLLAQQKELVPLALDMTRALSEAYRRLEDKR